MKFLVRFGIWMAEGSIRFQRKEKFVKSGHERGLVQYEYRGADKSLARPERKQATATEDFEFHISYL